MLFMTVTRTDLADSQSQVIRREAYVEAGDRTPLYYQTWSCERPRATILVTHGLGEHSEPYHRLGGALAPAGYEVLAWDLRGHGRSDGKRGVLRSFDDFTRDLDEIKKIAVQKGLPVYLLGHSMGGLITCKYVIDSSPQDVKGLILSSPFFGVAVEVPRVKEAVGRWLGKILPELTLFNEIKHSDLTHDRNVIKEFEIDTLRHDRVSPGLYNELLAALNYVPSRASKIKLPALIQQAGTDLIVSRPRTEEFFAHLGSSDKTLKIYDEFFHEIYNEVHRERPFSDLQEWLNQKNALRM